MGKFERRFPYPDLPNGSDINIMVEVMTTVNDMMAKVFDAEYAGGSDCMTLEFRCEEDLLANVLGYGDEDLRMLYSDHYDSLMEAIAALELEIHKNAETGGE